MNLNKVLLGESTDLSDVPRKEAIMASERVSPTSIPKMKETVELGRSRPAVAAVINESLKIFETDKTDWELAEEFVDTDPVVGGNAEALALLVQKAYRGPRLASAISEKDVDKETTKRKEVLTLQTSDEILYNMDFKGMLFSCGMNIWQDGDVVIRKLPNTRFMMLPRKYITALPRKYVTTENGKLKSTWHLQYGPATGAFNRILETPAAASEHGNEILTYADYYILNEGTAYEEVIPAEEVLHIKMHAHGRTTIDNMGRTCFNMWSAQPLRRIKKSMLWKANAMINDILWRDSMPPREHHKLDLSMFHPDEYEGETVEARIIAARTAAMRVVNKYIENISYKEVDVGYVTDKDTEIDVLESKSHTYADPNELVRQLDEDVHATSGVPRGMMYGEGKGGFASELLTSNYAGLRAEFIGDRIARPFEDWLKEYMKANYADVCGIKVINRLRLKFRLILARDMREIAQAINFLVDSMVVDVAQILETMGLDPMTPEQFDDHLQQLEKLSKTGFGKGKQQLDTKGTERDAKSESRKQEPPTTKARKELAPKT